MVTFENVSKQYGDVVALDDFNLEIAAGRTLALLGPNGAGKTTAISLLLGLRKPTRGLVRVLGYNPRDLRAHSAIGPMLQSSGLPSYLRVSEAIALFSTYYPKPLAIGRVLELAGLEHLAKTRVTSLSGGELQRLYFALAICGDPEILVLDEPSVGLDVEARRGMLETIRGIAGEGRTIVLTTHYLEEADALADRIVVIDRGHIVADGSPAAIKQTVGRKRVCFTSGWEVDSALLARNDARVDFRDGNSYRLSCAAPERLLGELFAAGVQLEDLTVTGASLEEAFLHLTTGHDSNAA
ncbi:MAG: ABC transporter ATP-binding protein [Candidatus Meridianibacter frigidus]|nr:MAG: ABC transporter ATP-binding protein [Candidatus Eremiobacteraeota bacterium]